MDTRVVTRLVTVLLVTLAAAPNANAQPARRLYAGGLVGPYQVDGDHVIGTTTSTGATGGIRVLPWLDIEIDVVKPRGVLTREYTAPSVSFTPGGGSEQFVVTRFINERQLDLVFSAGVSFHPTVAMRRITPRFFAGISNHRVQDRTVLEHLYLPPGVTQEQLNRTMPPQGWRTRNLGGPTIGASLSIDVTDRLSIGPDIRYDYGSIGDEINNMLRSSVRLVWRF